MPNLTYTVADFLPFTKILSADVNARFQDIKTLLNTTKLDTTNIQQYGIARDRIAGGTANYAVYNDASGYLTEAASLPSTAGGLGFIPTISVANVGKVVGVNDAGSSLELRSPEASLVVEQLAGNVATLTSGQVLAVNDAVCLDLIDGKYRVMKTDYSFSGRSASFLGFALNTTTATPQITTATKFSAWTSGALAIIVNGRTYSYTFAASNDASMTALAALVASDTDVTSAVVGASPINVITITTKGSLTATITSTGTPTLTIANTQTAVGTSVRVQMFGPLSGFTLTISNNYYLDSTVTGGITASPLSTINQISVGQAISSSVLFINPNRFNLNFATSAIFVQSHGCTTLADATGTATAYHFNFTSWSSGTSDSTALNRVGTNGSASYNGAHFVMGGYNTAGTSQNRLVSYNKITWSTLTSQGTARVMPSCIQYSSSYYVNRGDKGGNTTDCDKFNGTTWSSTTAWAATGLQTGAFTTNSLLDSFGGTLSVVHHTKNTSDTNSTATAKPGSQDYIGGSSNAAGGSGISKEGVANTTTYAWNGATWSSAIADVINGDESSFAPAHFAYSSASAATYIQGGVTNDTDLPISNMRKYATTITADTAMSVVRASGCGSVI